MVHLMMPSVFRMGVKEEFHSAWCQVSSPQNHANSCNGVGVVEMLHLPRRLICIGPAPAPKCVCRGTDGTLPMRKVTLL